MAVCGYPVRERREAHKSAVAEVQERDADVCIPSYRTDNVHVFELNNLGKKMCLRECPCKPIILIHLTTSGQAR